MVGAWSDLGGRWGDRSVLGWDGKTEDQEIAIMARFPVRMRKLSAASNNHNNNSKITCKTVMVFVVSAAAAAVEQ